MVTWDTSFKKLDTRTHIRIQLTKNLYKHGYEASLQTKIDTKIDRLLDFCEYIGMSMSVSMF